MNILAKKTQVQCGLALTRALVSSFLSQDCEQNMFNQAEDLARPVGPDRLPGAGCLRNAVLGQGDLSSKLRR